VTNNLLWLVLGLGGVIAAGLAVRRLAVALFTMRARSLTPLLLRLLSRRVRTFHYAGDRFFDADGANEALIAQRRQGLERLSGALRAQYATSDAWSEALRESFSDLRFTDANRVPFPFAQLMRENFNLASVVTASDGPRLQHLDGHWTLDVSGSYGVNVAGSVRYKEWMTRGLERTRDLGMVLGPLHPLVADNIARLRAVSGLDEVSFHMSGTEAVMQAVRLARYHTRRTHLVRFAGAYHGWWGDVQPGIGNPVPPRHTYTLKDMDEDSLRVLRKRRDIACVLVNPLQGLHPNRSAPGDGSLVDSARSAHFDRRAYAGWLKKLRDACTERAIALIFDEILVGRAQKAGARLLENTEAVAPIIEDGWVRGATVRPAEDRLADTTEIRARSMTGRRKSSGKPNGSTRPKR
jgi:glutamate-1-semialdehyde 2,1-aminomutase